MTGPLGAMRGLILPGMLLASLVQACPIKPPEGLTRLPVAETLITNGLPMSMLRIESKEPVAALLARTASRWRDEGYLVKLNRAAGWEIVSALADDCLATLQLMDRGGAVGYFSVTEPPRAAVMPRIARVPLPRGLTVTSSVASLDAGRRGLTLTMSSDRSLDDLNLEFLKAFDREGWGALDSHEISGRNQRARTLKLTAQRQRERIELVIWRDERTRMVMTIADAL